MRVLISSAGRRVGLIQSFRSSGAWVGAADAGVSAPARFVADQFWQVPRCTEPGYADTVLDICRSNGIGLVIPAIDTELPVYARERERFEAAGVSVCISSPETIAVACDKVNTHAWLVQNGFPTVGQWSPSEALSLTHEWPLIAKPHDGSASIGVGRIANQAELRHLAETKPSYIVQQMATGREFTVNLYVNRQGKCICAVPHWRMEVRAGEVSKGMTVKDRGLMKLGRCVAEALPGARGALNMQCFMDSDGAIAIIEINARFGGGYPLAHQAGARFTDWLLNTEDAGEFDDWTDGLVMLRYDEAVYVTSL